MRKFFFIIFLLSFFSSNGLLAQEKWALIQDLNEKWIFFDEDWLPVTDRFDSYEAIHFRVDALTEGSHLLIEYPGTFSVFLNNKIYYLAADSLMINIDSLVQAGNSFAPLITVYSTNLRPVNLRTQIYIQYDIDAEPEVNNVINVIKRKNEAFADLAIVALLFLLLYLVLLKTFYPRNLADFYSLRKTVSSRDLDEDFLRGRLFSQVNVLIMIFQCLVIGLFITLLLFNLNTGLNDTDFDFMDYLQLWLEMSIYCAGFILLKFILIRNFTSLYNMNNFSTPHFMSSLRILTFIFGVGLLLLYTAIFAFGWTDIEIFQTHLNVVLVALGISMLFIYVKLLNLVSYKKLHLFSYLCATEILPYVVVLKIAINQSI